MFTSDVAQVSAAFFLLEAGHHCLYLRRRAVRTLMLTIASSLYIDKLPLADGENEYASHTVFFDNFDVFYFGSLVRARMDGVCQPRRQIHVPFPGTTKSNRDHLSIRIRSRSSGARL